MNERYSQLVNGQKTTESNADPLKTANDTSEMPSTSKKLFAVLRKSSRGNLA